MSPSFYFRWKDLLVQSNAFRPELCTKNIYQTVQTSCRTTEVSRNAFNNILGRYTCNCSNSRTVLNSGQIVNETTSRSGIFSEHEQVSSYSHPKKNFSGFCYRLCKYDNFSPSGKTIGNNSEGQFIVRSKFDLYSKPVSVCGHVFRYTPSTKASSFALQKSLTLYKQSIKQSWSEKKLCYNQKIPLDFQVHQNLEWWVVEMTHHCTAPVIPPPVHVKIVTNSFFLGWGATMGRARIADLWE